MKKHGPLKEHEVLVKGWVYCEVPPDFAAAFAGRHKGKTREASIACLYSHFQLWLRIADDSIGSIICEDDSTQCRSLDVKILQSCQSVVLLGGVIRTSDPWASEGDDYLNNGAFMDRILQLQRGLNPLGENKFTGTISYFVPPVQAMTMCRYVALCLQGGAKLRVCDALVKKCGADICVMWPNCYTEAPNCLSQCGSPAKDGGSDLYMSREMQAKAPAFFARMLTNYPHYFDLATPGSSPMPTPATTPPVTPRPESELTLSLL
jgi:hypothetical protein